MIVPFNAWIFCEYSDLQSIAKVGEGTYGEAFVAGQTVCKVVPFDGDSLVNGEVQKVVLFKTITHPLFV